MAYEQIRYALEDRIATVTLSRPEKLNAWTPLMEREVRQAMETAEGDERVRVIVLTGTGRGFCAGSDMKRFARWGGAVEEARLRRARSRPTRLVQPPAGWAASRVREDRRCPTPVSVCRRTRRRAAIQGDGTLTFTSHAVT